MPVGYGGKWMISYGSNASTATTADYAWGLDYGTATTNAAYHVPIEWERWKGRRLTVDIDGSNLSDGAFHLPDGAVLHVSGGNYRIEDKDAKITYQANNNREFSPYLNASDMLAKFVEYVGSLGVKRQEVMQLPIQLFVAWLVIESAERDGDPLPEDIVPVAKDRALIEVVRPRCLCCGRYIKRLHARHRFPFCSPSHGVEYSQRLAS